MAQWARDDNPGGYLKTTLVLYGESVAGKTHFAKALCVHKHWPFIFVSDVDALRAADVILPHYAIIIDEADFTAKDPDWVKHVFDVEHHRDVRVRWYNMYAKQITGRAE